MSDISFIPYTESPSATGWIQRFQSSRFQLFERPDSGPRPCLILERNHIAIVVLSYELTPERLIDRIARESLNFREHSEVASGIVWNTLTDEFLLFRDNFGFTPWLGVHKDGQPLYTTSPDEQAEWTRNHALNRRWFAAFLREEDTADSEDFCCGAFRVRPGDAIYQTRSTPEQFLAQCVSQFYENTGEDHFCTAQTQQICDNLWENRRYSPFDASESELAEELRRHLIDAANRIPGSNPCFTLSGGLDSTGILSAWFQHHSQRASAISLVSSSHKSCDESHELDILERAFPIDLLRVDMDHAWPLSEPDLYRKYHGYGPLCSPGIESMLAAFRAAENRWGAQTIVTGYGGNFIVKVRPEAILYDLIQNHPERLPFELKSSTRANLRYLMRRLTGNALDGKIRAIFRHFNPPKSLPNNPEFWLHPSLSAQFLPETHDPVCFMSHCEERAWIPLSSTWELSVRSIDILARQTSLQMYDPLFDLKVYDFCARIPPVFMQSGGIYRSLYIKSLTPLLPAEILNHPKCQSFDDQFNDGLCIYAAPLLENAIADPRTESLFAAPKLRQAFDLYRQSPRDYPMETLWRSLSTCLWMT